MIGQIIGTATVGTGDFTLFSTPSLFYQLFDGRQDVITLVEVNAKKKLYPWTLQVPTYKWMHNPGRLEWRDEDENFLPRLEHPWNYERQATGENPFGSVPDAISYGALKIHLEPDDWEMYKVLLDGETQTQEISKTNWNHASVTIKVGLQSFAYSDFETVFVGNIKNAEWTEDTLTLNIRDPDELLTEEIQKTKYAGTGGFEGTVNMTDQPKPLLYGYGLNIQPVLVDPVYGIWQIHDGEVESIDEIFDGGYSFGAPEFDISAYPGKDLYDWEEIVAPGVPEGGQWITDKANGLLRVATGVYFTLTCNAYGSKHSERPYSANAAYVCEAILIDRIGVSAANIFGVVELDSVVPYEVGVYIRSGGQTANSVIQGILAPLQCFLGYSKTGKYEMRALRKGTSTGTIENFEVQQIKRLSETPEPVSTLRMSWGHNWTVRAEDQLAENRSDEFAEFSVVEDRYYSVNLDGVGNASGSLKEMDIDTYLINEGDAKAEVERQYVAMVGSDIYEIVTSYRFLGFLPGDTAKLAYEGFDFAANPLFMLLSVRENGNAGTNTYRAWGNFTYDAVS